MGTHSCCQQKNHGKRLQTPSMIQTKIKFVKESKYTWIICSFICHGHYYLQVKSWPRVTMRTSLLGRLKKFVLKKKNLPTKKFQQLLASAIYHLTSLAPEDPDMQVLRSISPNLWPLPHFDQDVLLTSPYIFMFIHNSKILLTLFLSTSQCIFPLHLFKSIHS